MHWLLANFTDNGRLRGLHIDPLRSRESTTILARGLHIGSVFPKRWPGSALGSPTTEE